MVADVTSNSVAKAPNGARMRRIIISSLTRLIFTS
jgi:hypothetical protein